MLAADSRRQPSKVRPIPLPSSPLPFPLLTPSHKPHPQHVSVQWSNKVFFWLLCVGKECEGDRIIEDGGGYRTYYPVEKTLLDADRTPGQRQRRLEECRQWPMHRN